MHSARYSKETFDQGNRSKIEGSHRYIAWSRSSKTFSPLVGWTRDLISRGSLIHHHLYNVRTSNIYHHFIFNWILYHPTKCPKLLLTTNKFFSFVYCLILLHFLPQNKVCYNQMPIMYFCDCGVGMCEAMLDFELCLVNAGLSFLSSHTLSLFFFFSCAVKCKCHWILLIAWEVPELPECLCRRNRQIL